MSIMLLRDLQKLFKMRKIVVFLPLNLIMEESFKMKDLKFFVKSLELNIVLQHPKTPQQNGVAKRKNRSLEELASTLLNETGLPKYFWADVVSVATGITTGRSNFFF